MNRLTSCIYALIAPVVMTALLLASFVVFEPIVSHAITGDFTVQQTITGEISFKTAANNVVMDTAIASLTGGTANGTSTVVVSTSDSDGYNMTIHFSSSTAMNRNGGNGEIDNYSPAVGGTPDYNFDTSEVFAQFAYSVNNTVAADVDPTFRDNGTDTCATGASNTYGACWFNPEPVGGAETIINRSSATDVAGSTTTINFRVYVPPTPNPTVPDGTYTATATLTALVN